VEDGPEGPVLLTAPPDAPALARLPSLTVEEVAGLFAAVASTLADLHDLGFVHGGLTAEQVLVGADGHPLLRGFGHGGRVGEPPVAEPTASANADPARAEGDPLDPTVDVFALGALIRGMVDTAGGTHRDRVSRSTADALRSVADRATAPDPGLRLSARALADAVRHAVPEARLPRRATPEPLAGAEPQPVRPGPPLRRPVAPPVPRGRRRSWFLAGAAVVAVAVMGLAVVTTSRPASRPAPGSVAPPTPPAATTTLTRRTVVTAVPAGACPEVDSTLAADTDGDGCPEALRWSDGVVEAGGARWAVGGPGDLVATGDWACRGGSTLALLRPATGDVFVFDSWPSPGQELTATAVTRVDGGFALRSADLDADGCPELLVERPHGPPVAVPRRSLDG
jgi:hypothetical protein